MLLLPVNVIVTKWLHLRLLNNVFFFTKHLFYCLIKGAIRLSNQTNIRVCPVMQRSSVSQATTFMFSVAEKRCDFFMINPAVPANSGLILGVPFSWCNVLISYLYINLFVMDLWERKRCKASKQPYLQPWCSAGCSSLSKKRTTVFHFCSYMMQIKNSWLDNDTSQEDSLNISSVRQLKVVMHA